MKLYPLSSLSDWVFVGALCFSAGFFREMWGFENVVIWLLIFNLICSIKR